jgi:hypothetical protein
MAPSLVLAIKAAIPICLFGGATALSVWAQELGLPGWQWLLISAGFYTVAAVLSLLLLARTRLAAAWAAFSGPQGVDVASIDHPNITRTWLDDVALGDHASIGNRVRCSVVQVRSGLRHVEPFLFFEISVYNGSVFFLKVERLEGLARLDGSPLPHLRVLDSPVGTAVPHAHEVKIGIRVFIPERLATAVHESRSEVSIGDVGLWFTYDYIGERNSVRLGFGNSYLRIGNWEAPSNAH